MMEKGKVICKMQTAQQKRARVQKQLDSLWEENKRLSSPQTFILSLSEKLLKLKNKLLAEAKAGS